MTSCARETIMADKEEWTVVGSKSRSKKASTEEDSFCKKNDGQTKKKRHPSSQGDVIGVEKASTSSSNYHPNKREEAFHNRPDTSKTFQRSIKPRPRSTAYRKDAKIEGRKILLPTTHFSAKPAETKITANEQEKLKPVSVESSHKLPTTAHTKSHGPNDSGDCVVQQVTRNNNVFPKQISDRDDNVPGPSNVATVDAPKKKKRTNKEDRRKKREEKFYQALYQNKDSHIQFVSADMIRKIQNNQRVPASKPAPTRKLFPSATIQTDIPQSFNDTRALLRNFEDFPSLTPVKCNEEVLQDISLGSSPPDNSKLKLSIDSPLSKVESSVSGEDKQVVPTTSKFVCDTNIETLTDKTKATPTLPTTSSKGKKSKQPMIIDVSSLIVNKRDVSRKSASTSTPYGRTGILKKENFKITAGNPLDSSGPGVINRGKIRQKKKKPTKLKLTILKSRALKRILLEEENKQNVEKSFANGNTEVKVSFDDSLIIKTEIDDVSVDLASEIQGLSLDVNVKSEPKVDIESDANISFEEDLCPYAEVKTEEIQNKENAFPDNDMSLKFIKLLDEISMLKITDEALSPEIEVAVKASMHNRKFRDYCDMYTSKELHRLVMNLLAELFRFQDRLYHTDPIKFKTKRRFVSGLKEALCYLNLNKVQLIIIAPDIEKNPEPGGLDEKITQILTVANGKGVPYVFSGSKYNLGKSMRIKTPISIISVLDKQNCEDTFRALLEEANQLREKYHNDFAVKAKQLKTQEN